MSNSSLSIESSTLIAGTIVIATAILILYIIFAKLGATSKSDDISSQLRKEQQQTIHNLAKEQKLLNPATFTPFKILKIIDLTHNTKLFRFEIPFGRKLGLSIGRHISVRATINDNPVIRAYTPTSRPDQPGFFDLVVKRYESGKISPYLHTLKVGSSVDVRGPIGRFKYVMNTYQKIGLVAGGTGITPCLQILRYILECPEMKEDKTNFILFFQNRTEDDIILRDLLDKLASTHPNRLQIIYFLSSSQSDEFANPHSLDGKFVTSCTSEKRGYIQLSDVEQHMNRNICQLVCICGPSSFNESMNKLLLLVGHQSDQSIFIW